MATRPVKRAPRKGAVAAPRQSRTTARAIIAEPVMGPRAAPGHEPVWLVRSVIVLFLVGFAAFLAREIANFVTTLP